jgi:hypothetical protein
MQQQLPQERLRQETGCDNVGKVSDCMTDYSSTEGTSMFWRRDLNCNFPCAVADVTGDVTGDVSARMVSFCT